MSIPEAEGREPGVEAAPPPRAARFPWGLLVTAPLAVALIVYLQRHPPLGIGMAPSPGDVLDRLRLPANRWLTLILCGAHLGATAWALLPARWRPGPGEADPPFEDTSWASLSLKIDGLIALLLTAFVAGTRLAEAQIINPDFLPYASDWDTFVVSARAWYSGDLDLWHPDKWPLYPLLIAFTMQATGLDTLTAAVRVSQGATILSTPFLYLAVRLTLGMRPAIGACLLFATTGIFNYYANASTLYAVFCGMTLLQAGSVAAAVKSERLWAWLLAGITLGVGGLVDVKILTTGLIFSVMLVWGLLRTSRGILWRLGAAVTAAIPMGLGWLALDRFPAHLNLLGPKLTINAQEFIQRWARESPYAPRLSPGEQIDASLLPDLYTRLHFNSWWMRMDLASAHWQLLVPLCALGIVAPLLVWRIPLRARLVALEGSLFHVAILGSTSGAFVLFYMKKYVVHAAPFFLALTLAGAFTLARWLTPRGPTLLRAVAGWAFVGWLAVIGLPIQGILDPSMVSRPDKDGFMVGALWPMGDDQTRTVREALQFAESLREGGAPLWVCAGGELPPYRGMVEPVPEYLKHKAPGIPNVGAGYCAGPLNRPAEDGAVWVVDRNLHPAFLKRFEADPARFERAHHFKHRRALVEGIDVYVEHAAEGLTAPETTPP